MAQRQKLSGKLQAMQPIVDRGVQHDRFVRIQVHGGAGFGRGEAQLPRQARTTADHRPLGRKAGGQKLLAIDLPPAEHGVGQQRIEADAAGAERAMDEGISRDAQGAGGEHQRGPEAVAIVLGHDGGRFRPLEKLLQPGNLLRTAHHGVGQAITDAARQAVLSDHPPHGRFQFSPEGPIVVLPSRGVVAHHLFGRQAAELRRQHGGRFRIGVQHGATIVAQAPHDRVNQVPAAGIRLQARDQHAPLAERHVVGRLSRRTEIMTAVAGPILQPRGETPIGVAAVDFDVPEAGQRRADGHAAEGRRRQVLLDLPDLFRRQHAAVRAAVAAHQVVDQGVTG